ncbi:MAG TPA: small multi-drug export protein [Clostridiales bacterium]|nr:small multi-drug export protein [Clostridiales bacterium]
MSFLNEILDFLSVEFTVMFTATLPVIELRGAIPVGISLGLSSIHSTVLSFIGSMIPVPILLFTVRPVFKSLKNTKTFKNIIAKLTRRSLRKSGKVHKYGFWGLILLVAIPLPGTGVWTGTIIAALLNMRFKRAFLAILIGNLIAAIIVMTVSSGVFNAISWALL